MATKQISEQAFTLENALELVEQVVLPENHRKYIIGRNKFPKFINNRVIQELHLFNADQQVPPCWQYSYIDQLIEDNGIDIAKSMILIALDDQYHFANLA